MALWLNSSSSAGFHGSGPLAAPSPYSPSLPNDHLCDYRIFTTLPDTGERMYLSNILPGILSPDEITTREYDHLSHRPAELDVTHLLPSWSIRLRPYPTIPDYSASTAKPPATLFRNKRSVHPFVIGQREGTVRIELIAASKDSQPLAYKDVSIVASEKNDFVRLKVQCIVS